MLPSRLSEGNYKPNTSPEIAHVLDVRHLNDEHQNDLNV